MTEAESYAVVEDLFRRLGVSAIAPNMAGLFCELVECRVRHVLVQRFVALRGCVGGEALFRELAGDDPAETLENAAARLHTSPRELRRHRARFHALLNGPCPGG